MNEAEYAWLRKEMVDEQIRARGVSNPGVLDAFMKVFRHHFVPEEFKILSYEDYPLPIGYNQTISQPYIVAFMTEILKLHKHMRVLEIGTGSGYQAAILSCLCREVFTVEIVPELARNAVELFESEGLSNIRVRTGDGYQGWPGQAPFDSIIVTCAPWEIPQSLIDQLAEGGRMIIPAGERFNQRLYLLQKENGKILQVESLRVAFVPMVHKSRTDENS